jgi:hypothetical protein
MEGGGSDGLLHTRNPGNCSPAAPAPSLAAAAFTPDALSVATWHLEVGGERVASFAVVGFPREVHPG